MLRHRGKGYLQERVRKQPLLLSVAVTAVLQLLGLQTLKTRTKLRALASTGVKFFLLNSLPPMAANTNWYLVSGNLLIKKSSSSYPAARFPEEDPHRCLHVQGWCEWQPCTPLLPAALPAQSHLRLCGLVAGRALAYLAGSSHGLLPHGQPPWHRDGFSLICTTTSSAVPLQIPHSSETGLHGAACAPMGYFWVSSMGLWPCLSWHGPCPFSDPSYSLPQIWFRRWYFRCSSTDLAGTLWEK